MRNSRSLTAAAVTLIIAASLPWGVARAQNPSAMEKAELAQLNPQLRREVNARLTGKQTVRGVLETMLLNNISLSFASNRVVAMDFDKGVVVAEGKNDQLALFPFDVVTLAIKK
jgi:hypothetical protein